MGADNILNNIRKPANNFLYNIKSKYILIRIFGNLTKPKMLRIIKKNKTIQNKLEINSNDYMTYSEILNPVEIEIIPVQNSKEKFINTQINDYIHVYFDDNKNNEIRYKIY